MQKITLKNIKVYAYHGCMEEETKIGSFYLINVTLWLNLEKAGKSDLLNDTVNYGEITQIVKNQMSISSHLLEHVTHRILREIEIRFKEVKTAKVSVAKVNPPVNADIDRVKITFKKNFY